MVVSKRALRRYIDRAVAREVRRIRYTDGLVDGISLLTRNLQTATIPLRVTPSNASKSFSV